MITALMPDGDGGQAVVSSSTKPGLMARMLQALDVTAGQRVLEIGTGTGYNTALVCNQLADADVFSIDIGTQLVSDARNRLAALGHHPTVEAGNGLSGLLEHAPYDRLIATCAVPAIPPAWQTQLSPGGTVLADLKVGLHAGSLVLLRHHDNHLEGRFLRRWAGFMPARDTNGLPRLPARPHVAESTVEQTTTRRDPDPWAALVPWFLAQIGRPPVIGLSRRGIDLDTHVLLAKDDAWCEIGPRDSEGRRLVRQGGPRRIWDDIEQAHDTWDAHDRPTWDRLGLTVAPDKWHYVWIDEPRNRVGQFLPGTHEPD